MLHLDRQSTTSYQCYVVTYIGKSPWTVCQHDSSPSCSHSTVTTLQLGWYRGGEHTVVVGTVPITHKSPPWTRPQKWWTQYGRAWTRLRKIPSASTAQAGRVQIFHGRRRSSDWTRLPRTADASTDFRGRVQEEKLMRPCWRESTSLVNNRVGSPCLVLF